MTLDTGFDFDAAVAAPFRMQPGLRRLAAGARQLTPLPQGSRHQREKLAVLSAYWAEALSTQPGFDPRPALHAVAAQAASEHPAAWSWDGARAHALQLGTAVGPQGEVEFITQGGFGVGDEISRCLNGLPPEWRLAGLLALCFAEDLAIVDGSTGCIPWMCVCLPSHWAPQDKVGLHFASVHAPVADNQTLLKASAALLRLVTGPERWERFVWTVTDHPRLHAHPSRTDSLRWQHTPVERAWWRTERQTFIPVPAQGQAVFTIAIEVQHLREALDTPERSAALQAALASMSPAVLDYRHLAGVHEPLLAWLAQHTMRLQTAPARPSATTPAA